MGDSASLLSLDGSVSVNEAGRRGRLGLYELQVDVAEQQYEYGMS